MDAIHEHLSDLVGGLRKINPIKVFLGNCGEDCAYTDHVFLEKMALQRIKKEVLLIPVRADRRDASPNHDLIARNVDPSQPVHER